MSATYNWAYRPGVANKYGITIASSADNVKPSNAVYVALFGNDTTGNGSRQYPVRTIDKACTIVGSSNIIVVASGVYREYNTQGVANIYIVGDGDVTIDFSYFDRGWTTVSGGGNGMSFFNLTWIGNNWPIYSFSGSSYPVGPCFDCTFIGTAPVCNGTASISGTGFNNCTFKAYTKRIDVVSGDINSCTFAECNYVGLSNKVTNCILYKCNVNLNATLQTGYPRYSLFYQCNFSFTGATGGALYPTVPTGYSYYSTISALKAAFSTAFPLNTTGLNGCTVDDPLFNNSTIGDYTLAFNSPAKNLSYFGTYVGAYSIAQSIKVRATESAGGFEFASAVNCAFANDSLTLTDPTQNAQVDTNPIVNVLGREIARLPSFGFNADRNGQYIDSIADLSASVYNPGDTLPSAMPFIVEVGAIVYNGATYQAGERGTTVAAATTFSTTASGVIREITEAPQRHTVMARFSDGGAAVSSGTALTSGNYYFVVSGSVTYDSTVYNAGIIFKAIDTNSFSGSGSVVLAFSTESFQHYEPGIKPTSNNTGDSRTGAIVRGNGDPSYDRSGLGVKEFPINAKFIQIRYIIRVTNLKP